MNAQSGLDCNNSIPVVSSNSCIFQSFTTSGPEMWFQFIPNSQYVNISLEGEFFGVDSPHVHYMALIGGSCGSPIIIADDELPFIDSERKLQIGLNASNLIIGNTYYIQVKREGPSAICDKTGCTGGTPATFDICIQNIDVIIPLDFGLESPNSAYTYTTNRGQLLKTDGTTAPDVKLYNTSLYFTDSSVSYLLAKFDTISAAPDTFCRVDMTLVGRNTGTKIFKTEQAPGVKNYFLSHTPHGVVNNKSYYRTVTTDVYPNIDIEWYSNSVGEKFYFIIKPGGNPDDIILQFDGATSVIAMPDGSLKVITPIGNIEYEPPHAYRINPGNHVVPMPWQAKFVQVTANSVKFETHEYDPIMPLFIQVDKGHSAFETTSTASLEWSTFFTSAGSTKVFDVDHDASGNTFACGTTVSPSLPEVIGLTTSDNFSTGSSFRAFLTKIAPDLRPLFHCYYGGDGDDIAYGISVTKFPTIVGSTKSTDLLDKTNTGLDYDVLRGSEDGFLVVFNLNGTDILCDSYIGGDGIDWCAQIDQTTDGVVAITGYTESSTNFPIQTSSMAGAYNQSYKGGGDAFLITGSSFAFGPASPLVPLWVTFFGGVGYDRGIDVKIGDDYKIWLYGYTGSTLATVNSSPCLALANPNTDFCICTIGTPSPYNQTTFGGGSADMFLAEFKDQQLAWSTYVGGVGSEFFSYGDWVETGGMDLKYSANPDDIEIVIAGVTDDVPFAVGVDGVPYNTINAYTFSCQDYTTGNFGTIGKFVNHSLKWYTLFGGTNTASGVTGTYINDISFSTNGSIFIAGETKVENNQAIVDYCTTPTAGEYPLCNLTGTSYFEDDYHVDNVATINTNSPRSFIAGFGNDGKLYWSTKFGNRPENRINGITTNTDGKLYIGGYAWTVAGLSYLSAYPYTLEDYNPSSTDDLFNSSESVAVVGTLSRFIIDDIVSVENINDPYYQSFIYPNPSSDQVNIQLNINDNEEEVLVNIFDLSGKLVGSVLN